MEKATQYHKDTPERVKYWLEHVMHTDRRVRLFYGDIETGRYWGDEYDVTGTIGRSTGLKPIPLLLANINSSGGGGILDGCIVRMFVKGRGGWQEVYRHPTYNSVFETATVKESELSPQYSHAVALADGSEEARFHSEKSAIRWLAFMRGERMSK